jgi:hypothetical protein
VPDWSIRIVPVNPSHPAGPAEFEPQGESPGRPLEAWVGDTVTWNNTTDAAHWPWPTDADYKPLNVQPGDLGYMSACRCSNRWSKYPRSFPVTAGCAARSR